MRTAKVFRSCQVISKSTLSLSLPSLPILVCIREFVESIYVAEKMNRDITGETDSLQQTSSSSYLVYLFIFSAAFIVFFPYLFPFSGMLLRSGKGVDTVGKVKSGTFKKSTSSAGISRPTDTMLANIAYSESKCEALEDLVMDLQRVVQFEREKVLKLENEVRVLQISEGYLKDRVQHMEDKSLESRRDWSASYTPPSGEFAMRTTLPEGKQENLDALVHELLRMVLTEKDRTLALEMEVRILQKSEIILISRIQQLEEKFASYETTCRQTNVFDSENEQSDSTRD